MNLFKKSIYALSLVSMTCLWSCSQEEMLSGDGDLAVKGQPVKLTLTVNRGGVQTRTILTEDASTGGLVSKWKTGDKLYVYDTNGNKVGTLELESLVSPSVGVFSGTVTAEDGIHDYSFWHYTVDGEMVFTTEDSNSHRLTVNVANQNFTSIEDLSALDILTSNDPSDMADVQVIVKDGQAAVAKDITLRSRLAMAHFSLSGIDPNAAGTLKIYDVNDNIYIQDGLMFSNTGSGNKLQAGEGEGIKVTISEGQTDVYVALIPTFGTPLKEYTLGFELTDTDNGKVYTYQFINPTVLKAGVYYSGNDGKGFEIPMNEVKVETPDPVTEDEDLVGPPIKIGDKYYRFVRGNLYCDILDKDNYTWHLYDRETDYQLKAGTSSLYISGSYTSYVRQINGTWKGSSNPANVNENNHYIDLFAWGATGLGTGDYKAKLPDVIRKGIANESTSTSYTGAHWPSDVTNTMDVNGNANILDLWKGYSFSNPEYDFGYAYMQNGRPAEDTRTFVTAPLEAYAYICDQERSFSQGCVVKGAGYDGKSDAQGALILYGITTIEDAKAAIESVGGKTKTGFNALTPNKPKSGFTYLIELPDYEALQALNKVKEVNGKAVNIQALFFASGGNGVYNFSSGVVNLNSTDGAYWTSDGAKGSSTTANAYGFYFRNTTSATEFCWKIDASGVSSKRNTQRSVRLMVEVPDPNASIVVD